MALAGQVAASAAAGRRRPRPFGLLRAVPPRARGLTGDVGRLMPRAHDVGIGRALDGKVSWQPTIDVMRVILGGQLLGLAAILALRRLIERRVTGHPPLSSGE